MSVDPSTLSQYQGKKVVLTYELDTPAEDGSTTGELEGTAQTANDLGVLIKPKGRTGLELLEASRVLTIGYAPEAPKPITAKTLKLVEYGNARNHLLERHALTLTEANELTEETALEYHASIDHVAADLGHVHGDKPVKPAAEPEAVAAE